MIARELASLAAIQLLKSFLATQHNTCCPEYLHISTGFISNALSKTPGLNENPWVYGLEKIPCLVDACPAHQPSLWEIGYDGPRSIRSDESIAEESGRSVTPSPSVRPVESRRSSQQIRWSDHPEQLHHVFHTRWWRKASPISGLKPNVKPESCPDDAGSFINQEASYMEDNSEARSISPFSSRQGTREPSRKGSPGHTYCSMPEYRASEDGASSRCHVRTIEPTHLIGPGALS